MQWGLVLILSAVLALHVHSTLRESGDHHDLVHWRLISLRLLHREPLAQPEQPVKIASNGHAQLSDLGPVYPPSTYLLLSPLTILSATPTMVIWLLLRVGCLWLSWWLTFRYLLGLSFARRDTWLITAILTALFYPIQEELVTGQTNSIILVLHVLGLIAIQRNRWGGGCLLALGNVLKPQLHLVWCALAVERRWAALASGVITTILIEGAAFWVGGAPLYMAYLHTPRFTMRWVEIFSFLHSHSLTAVILRVWRVPQHPERFPYVMFVVVVAGAALLSYAWRARRLRPTTHTLLYHYAFIISWMWLWSPMTDIHHLAWLLLPLWCLWSDLQTEHRSLIRWMFILGYILLATRFSLARFPAYQQGWLALLTAGHAAGILLIVWLCLQQFKRRVPVSCDKH